MRIVPRRPSAEFLWGHETCEGCAEMGVRGRMRTVPQGPSAQPLWGHETCEGCAEMGVRGRMRGTFGRAPMGPRNV
eukprot:7291099-Pyramimonas_sp.AAC.1